MGSSEIGSAELKSTKGTGLDVMGTSARLTIGTSRSSKRSGVQLPVLAVSKSGFC